MDNNNQKTDFLYDDDEAALKDLLMTLWLKKKFIIGLTATITILAGIYANNIKPIYEAKALIEVGKYNINANKNQDNWILVDSVPELIRRLNVLFIDLNNDKSFTITDISAPEESVGFINIKSNAESNELAVNGVKSVVAFIESRHKNIIDEVISRQKTVIKTIIATINKIQSLSNEYMENNINKFRGFSDSQQLLIEVGTDPYKIIHLIERKQLAESLILKNNYKNSKIVGGVVTSNHPVIPNKGKIIIQAFIGGFIFSILLALIMNVFRSKDEKAIA